MSVIVTCSCSAKVRLPEERLGKRLRCPRCRAEFIATADSRVATVAAGQEPAAKFCPICQSAIDDGEVTLSCPECRQVHHRECWAEVGGCSTYGCPRAPAAAKDESAAAPPRTAWGDTKVCPVCGETIKSIALRCRYCGTDFETVDPLTVRDIGKRERRKETSEGLQKTAWAVFILSLLGCTAPVMMIVNLVWFLPRRKQIARAGPVYLILGYVSLVVTVLYNVLGLFFVLFSS